jgi:hypothetical protein
MMSELQNIKVFCTQGEWEISAQVEANEETHVVLAVR